MAANGLLLTLPLAAALLVLLVGLTLSGLALTVYRFSRVPTSEAQSQREAAFVRIAQHAARAR